MSQHPMDTEDPIWALALTALGLFFIIACFAIFAYWTTA